MRTQVVNWEGQTNRFLRYAHGVFHIGANTGQERDIYAQHRLPVVWVEPLPLIFDKLQESIRSYPQQSAFQYLLTDRDGQEYDFGIANNDGQSSSIFDFNLHKEIWPQVGYVASIKIQSVTLKTMVEREEIDLAGFDALIMDVQGAELLVLQGAGELLDRFNWIRCEAADFEIYKDCCQVKDLDAFLLPRGFIKVRTDVGAGKPGIGNALEVLYARESVITSDQITALSDQQDSGLIRIKAVMSVPRYGSMATRGIIDTSLRRFGIPLETSQGVYWDQLLQKHFEDAKAQGVDWLLTVDYDSTFTAEQLDLLFHIFGKRPDMDALIALQARRGKDFPLCTIAGVVGEQPVDGEPFQVTTAHFGLSLFRIDALARLDKPWFFGMPNIYGCWGEGKASEDDQPIPWLVDAWQAVGLPDSNPEIELDPDIWFWHQWRRAGNTVWMTPQVRIGHGEELLRVYDEHMQPQIITVQQWRDAHKSQKLHTEKVEAAR